MSFGHFNYSGNATSNANANANNNSSIVPHYAANTNRVGQPQLQNNINNNYHHQQRSTNNNTRRVTEKRKPHGGAKSHKLLDEASYKNLFVARLPKSVGNDDLLALFAEFDAQSAVVMMDVATGKSKGFGFVTFNTEDEGRVACEAMSSRTLSIPNHNIHYHSNNSTTEMPDVIVLDIKPSTFNGQRIVVESRYVYFRNFPLQLFSSSTSSQNENEPAFGGGAVSYDQVGLFLSNFGSVKGVEFHNSNSSSANNNNQRFESDRPLLVSFGSQAEAQRAISDCHGKVLFPTMSSVPVMAKYADMTTVKAMDKRHRVSSQHQSQQLTALGSNSSLAAIPISGIGTPASTSSPDSVGLPLLLGDSLPESQQSPSSSPQHHQQQLPPYPALQSGRVFAPNTSTTPGSEQYQYQQQQQQSFNLQSYSNQSSGSASQEYSRVSSRLSMNVLNPHAAPARSSSSEIPSPPSPFVMVAHASSSSLTSEVSSHHHHLGGPPSTVRRTITQQQQADRRQRSSSSSTQQQALPAYRNDPYNRDGYVVMSSSSSSGSSSSSAQQLHQGAAHSSSAATSRSDSLVVAEDDANNF